MVLLSLCSLGNPLRSTCNKSMHPVVFWESEFRLRLWIALLESIEWRTHSSVRCFVCYVWTKKSGVLHHKIILTPFNFHRILLWSSVVFMIDWRKCLCKTSKITCRHASNQQTRNTTYRNIQYCYLLWSRKKVQLIEITLEWNDSFIIWFRDTLHFIIYIRKNNTCMTMTHMNIGMSTGSDWIGKVFIVIRNGNGYL